MPREKETQYNKSRKRYKKITFRVSEDEYETIKENAQKCLLSVNMYLLHMAVEGVIVVQNYENLSSLANAINKIGININQIAHYANEYGYVENGDWKIIREKMEDIYMLMINTIRTNSGVGVDRKKKMIKRKLRKTGSNGIHQKY